MSTKKNYEYRSILSVLDTQLAIKIVKDTFERELAKNLNLVRVSAPLFVRPETGLNDNLNGVERPVSFDIPDIGATVEIVHSLAKWKRMALLKYGIPSGQGLYTDMNAIRRDESLDELHSVYVDQWDWEKNIEKKDRTVKTLKETVNLILEALKSTELKLIETYSEITPIVPKSITFISSQELLDKYPGMTAKQREDAICREFGAVFVTQIGKVLSDGSKHDGRAPDYDDWELNGDILLWHPVLEKAFEISSMGIRVDENSLASQLKASGCEERAKLEYHRMLLNGELPYTIGGGIGQSRLCMLLLHKAHIGEVQAAIWPDQMIEDCRKKRINIL